jgi:hypothetical protein
MQLADAVAETKCRNDGILGTPMAWAVPQNKAVGGGLRHALDLLTAGTAQALLAGAT